MGAAKSIDALEQRVITLEQTVVDLTEAWKHINTLCVSDHSGTETCITKAQLDSFLNPAPHSEINQPAMTEEAEAWLPAAPIENAAAESLPSSEPPTIVGGNVLPDPETTGTVNIAISGAAVVWYPKVEIYEEAAARSDE